MNRIYEKICSTGQLSAELAASLQVARGGSPMPGDRVLAVALDSTSGALVTVLLCAGDLSEAEITAIDAIVAAHIPQGS
jgi:hypothetical protein